MDRQIARAMVGLKQLPIRALLATFWGSPRKRLGLSAVILSAYLLLQRAMRYRRLKRLQGVYAKYTTRKQMASMTDHDAWEIQKTILATEFPSASLKALQFALFRTYGIPTISSLLLKTSQFSNPATSFKRYADTGALIGQFMAFEPSSERAQTAIARTKFLHSGYRASGKILESDMLYTLSLFALQPIRFITMFEWRQLSELEQCAIGTYWKSLGDALEISFAELPSGPHGFRDGLHFLEELRSWSLNYEEAYMKPSPQNKEVADRTMDVLVYALPQVLKPVGVRFASCVMDNRLREAMMYQQPPAAYRTIFSSLVAARKFYLRYLALPRAKFQRIDVFQDEPNEYGRYYVKVYEAIPYYVKPTIWNRWGPAAWVRWALRMPLPGDDGDKYYPQGFDLEDLGPKYFEGKGRKSVAEIRDRLKKARQGRQPFTSTCDLSALHKMPTRSPDRLDAWILDSGIASLTAAVHLVQEAHVPPSRIHIVSKSSISSRTTVSYGDAEHGYDFRAGMRPQLNDMCMDTLLSLVPSMSDESMTLRDEIVHFAETLNPQKARTRFGLKPYHSAAEFRRYLHRFSDLHDLNDPHVLDLGKYNFHESIIVPITRFLHSQGVDFRYNTTISDILFAYDNPDNPTDPTRVAAIRTYPTHERYMPMSSKEEIMIELSPDDIVFSLFGSVFSAILTGDNTRSPPFLEHVKDNLDFDFAAPVDHFGSELDESWLLWLELCTKHPKFGNAYNFCTRLHESRLEFFTITLSSPEFFNRLAGTTCDEPGPNTILTLRDSSWLITLRIPHQPVFPNQPPSVQVCLGYALFPEKEGDYIGKPMLKCSGQEILTEVLQHLRYPLESILKNAIAIPHIQPRAAATFLPRNTEDRPRVIPPGMSNMAIIGPFVEIDDEVVVTTDYSVRGAQIAVRELMGVSRPVKKSKRASCIEILGML
ncbi:streptococcal 67 kDa myosin-cross-reactive antigen like family-domain-containing protein [Aspergillus egyptiacus]|nr:streptococcal 67 kDa myosin-cross-reactive antigen like family-domain-containing protein [Aspergillus egyptiacus]